MHFWTTLKNKIFTFYFSFKTTGYLNMHLRLKHIEENDHGIFGQLTIDENPFNCVTLENHLLYIPTGTYKVTLYKSPERGYKVPLLNDVPGRSFIEIHKGNWEYNSKGCILVGKDRDGFAIDASGDAFEELMTVIKNADDLSITIS